VLFSIIIAIRSIGRTVDLPLLAILAFSFFFLWMFGYNLYARRRDLQASESKAGSRQEHSGG
jgi:hypothetical protein